MATTTTSSTDRNTAVALKFIDALDQHRFDQADPMMASDFRLYFGGQELDKGQTLTLIRDVYRAFPDFRHEVQEVVAADDKVVIRFIDRGTHADVFEGIPASGRTFAIGQISIVRIAGEQVTEIREEADMLGLMQQLGAIPAST
jgi:steroid delta-isomerase-like uncharacterized protein